MLVRYGRLPVIQTFRATVFDDIEDGHWATPYIITTADIGWVLGYDDGTFRPDDYSILTFDLRFFM